VADITVFAGIGFIYYWIRLAVISIWSLFSLSWPDISLSLLAYSGLSSLLLDKSLLLDII
jgi:hypothetical protein